MDDGDIHVLNWLKFFWYIGWRWLLVMLGLAAVLELILGVK